MVGVGLGSVYRADLGALRGVVETDTLRALVRVDNVDGFALAYRVVGTFRFTGSATDTFIRNLVRHVRYSSLFIYYITDFGEPIIDIKTA
jgi:hypothetical protein